METFHRTNRATPVDWHRHRLDAGQMRRIDQTRTPTALVRSGAPLRVGYVPLCDCAPLVVAAESGVFNRYGLRVELAREVGWATVRDKIVHGQLDAAHALAAMPFAATLGIGSVPRECATGLVLNLQGNAVCLAMRYWQEGVRDAAGFGEFVRSRGEGKPLVFGVVSPVSSHRLLMEMWLRAAGLVPGRDCELAVIPPPQVPDVIRAGHVAGFCVGEPWNSVAIDRGLAWCAATSADLAPRHVEKVLMVTGQLAHQRYEEHLRLIAAVLEACELCSDPANHQDISALLARREYINAPAELLRRSFSGAFPSVRGADAERRVFTIYHDGDSNAPTAERGEWVLRHLLPNNAGLDSDEAHALVHRVFREDFFLAAQELDSGAARTETHKLEPEYA